MMLTKSAMFIIVIYERMRVFVIRLDKHDYYSDLCNCH